MLTKYIHFSFKGLKKGVCYNDKQDVNRRFCLITGLNISMQKSNSFLLSHAGLKYYYKTDKKFSMK